MPETLERLSQPLSARWPYVRLGDLGTWVGGGTPSKARPAYWIGGTIPWVSPKDMKSERISASEEYITPEAVRHSAACIVPAGSVLVVMRSGILRRTLPVAVSDRDLAINQDLKALTPNRTCDPDYVAWALRSRERALLNQCAKDGTTVESIELSRLLEWEIPLPPLAEQLRVVAVLQQALRLRRIRRYAFILSDAVLPSAFMELFGDPRSNPCGWDTSLIDDALESSQYGTSRKSNAHRRGFPVLGMANITSTGEVDLNELSHVELRDREFAQLRLKQGDVIFNRTNSTELVGKTACWRGDLDVVLASYLVRLRLRPSISPEFFVALLNTAYFKRMFRERCRKAIGQSNISATLLREMPMYVPPLPLQERFATFMDRHMRSREREREALRQAEHLFQSVLHRAFQEAQ